MNNGDAPPPYSPAPSSSRLPPPRPAAPAYNPREYLTPAQVRGYERDGILQHRRPTTQLAHARAAAWDGRESPTTFLEGQEPVDDCKTTTTTTSHMSNGDIVISQKIVSQKLFVFKGGPSGGRS